MGVVDVADAGEVGGGEDAEAVVVHGADDVFEGVGEAGDGVGVGDEGGGVEALEDVVAEGQQGDGAAALVDDVQADVGEEAEELAVLVFGERDGGNGGGIGTAGEEADDAAHKIWGGGSK